MLWVLVRLLLRIRGGENGSLRNHRRRNNLPRAVGAGYDQRGQRVAQVQQTLTLTLTPTLTPTPTPTLNLTLRLTLSLSLSLSLSLTLILTILYYT